MKCLYTENKSKQVGELCVCPTCLSNFIKNSYQQVFCRSKAGTYCKDQYWNKVDPKNAIIQHAFHLRGSFGLLMIITMKMVIQVGMHIKTKDNV